MKEAVGSFVPEQGNISHTQFPAICEELNKPLVGWKANTEGARAFYEEVKHLNVSDDFWREIVSAERFIRGIESLGIC